MLAPALLLAYALAQLRSPAGRWITIGVLVALAARSFVQAGAWTDFQTLSEHALWVNPRSPVANNNLGAAYFKRQDFTDARACFDIAVRERPDYLPARDNLAASLIKLGRYDEAIDLMKRTLALRLSLPASIRQPITPDLERLVTLLRQQGRTREADQYDAQRRRLDAAD